MSGLSDRAKALIPKARIMNFAEWTAVDDQAIASLQAADDEMRYLTDEELAAIKSAICSGDLVFSAVGIDPTEVVMTLREQAPAIVDEARAVVLATFPDILAPGGGLFPSQRADACWRDFWQFLRCITYGIAGAQHHYTSTDGLAAMEQLYEELQVPLPAMVVGLIGVKRASLRQFPVATYPALSPYFDHLIARLSTFVKDDAAADTRAGVKA